MQNDTAKIREHLQENYGVNIEKIEKIECGVLNSNYVIFSKDGEKYIFRQYNFKSEKDVDYEIDILYFLEKEKFPCPRIEKSNNGKKILIFNGCPSVVYKFIEGENISLLSLSVLFKVGKVEAELHVKLKDYKPLVAKETWEPEDIKRLFIESKKKMLKSEFPRVKEWIIFLEEELWRYSFPQNLPKGVTHQDIKGENIIIKDSGVRALIDFDNSYYGVLLHDITTTIIWTCFRDGFLCKEYLNSFLKGYEEVRKLTLLEKEYLLVGLKWRLVREIFIGPFVTLHRLRKSRERADYFMDLYKNITKINKKDFLKFYE
jgi:homoserine kinase type II